MNLTFILLLLLALSLDAIYLLYFSCSSGGSVRCVRPRSTCTYLSNTYHSISVKKGYRNFEGTYRKRFLYLKLSQEKWRLTSSSASQNFNDPTKTARHIISVHQTLQYLYIHHLLHPNKSIKVKEILNPKLSLNTRQTCSRWSLKHWQKPSILYFPLFTYGFIWSMYMQIVKLTCVASSTCATLSCFSIPKLCRKLPPKTRESSGVYTAWIHPVNHTKRQC